jgi:hypothetical protein
MNFIVPEAVAKKAIQIPSERTLKRFRPRMQFAAEAVGALRFSKSVHAIANHDGASIEQSKVFGEGHGLIKINRVTCASILCLNAHRCLDICSGLTMQCVKEHGKMEQVIMGGGLIYTQSKSAKHEFEVTKLVARVRHGVKYFDPIAQGGLVDPEEMSWHRVRGSMNDNAAAGTAALITGAVKTAAVDFYGKDVWDKFSAEEQLEKSSSYEFTC